jgi:hypothetical protein
MSKKESVRQIQYLSGSLTYINGMSNSTVANKKLDDIFTSPIS